MVGSVVVLYLHSTSNHNSELASEYLITSCIISSFYIKPQHIPLTLLIFNCLKTILGDMKLFDEAYLIQSY